MPILRPCRGTLSRSSLCQDSDAEEQWETHDMSLARPFQFVVVSAAFIFVAAIVVGLL